MQRLPRPVKTIAQNNLSGIPKPINGILIYARRKISLGNNSVAGKFIELIAAIFNLSGKYLAPYYIIIKSFEKKDTLRKYSKLRNKDVATINPPYVVNRETQWNNNTKSNENKAQQEPIRATSILLKMQTTRDDMNPIRAGKILTPRRNLAFDNNINPDALGKGALCQKMKKRSLSFPSNGNAKRNSSAIRSSFIERLFPRRQPEIEKCPSRVLTNAVSALLSFKNDIKFFKSRQFVETTPAQSELYAPSAEQSITNTARKNKLLPCGRMEDVQTRPIATEILLTDYLEALKERVVQPGQAMGRTLELLNKKYSISPQDDDFKEDKLIRALIYAVATHNLKSIKEDEFDINNPPCAWEEKLSSCLQKSDSVIWNTYETEILTVISQHIRNTKNEDRVIRGAENKNNISKTATRDTNQPTTPPIATEELIKLTSDYQKLEEAIESYCDNLKKDTCKPGELLRKAFEQTSGTKLKNEKFCIEHLFLALLYSAVSSLTTTNPDSNLKTSELSNELMLAMACAGSEIEKDYAEELLCKSAPYLSKLASQDYPEKYWNKEERHILSLTSSIARAIPRTMGPATSLLEIDKHKIHGLSAKFSGSNDQKICETDIETDITNKDAANSYAETPRTKLSDPNTQSAANKKKITVSNGLIVFSTSASMLLKEYFNDLEKRTVFHSRAMEEVLQYFGQNPTEQWSEERQNKQFLLSSLMYARNVAKQSAANANFDHENPLWTEREWEILSNIAYFLTFDVPICHAKSVTSDFVENTEDNAVQQTPQLEEIVTKQNPATRLHANLVFITSPPFGANSPDYKNIINSKSGAINEENYRNVLKKNLLPALRRINDIAEKQGKKAWVVIPEIHANYLTIGKLYNARIVFYLALQRLLKEHGAALAKIECVGLDPCAASTREAANVGVEQEEIAKQPELFLLPFTREKKDVPSLDVATKDFEIYMQYGFDPQKHIPFTFIADTKLALPGTEEFANLTGCQCQDELMSNLFIAGHRATEPNKTDDLEIMYLNPRCIAAKQNEPRKNKTSDQPSASMSNIDYEQQCPGQTQLPSTKR